MNKLLPVSAAVMLALSPSAFAQDADKVQQQDVEKIQRQIDDLKSQLRDMKISNAGQNLKFGVDYRVTLDSIEYTMADGSTEKNSDLIANRLWINMGYQYNDNLVFTGQLAYNKVYGESFYPSGFADFDWVVNSTPTNDNSVKVRKAYFLYLGDEFLGVKDLDWTFSLGRRPSNEGFLANHREGFDEAQSPLGHSINVEFDGLSLNTKFEEILGIPGAAFKICAGRGLTSTTTRFTMTGTDYAKLDGADDIDFLGFIATPYNDGQYDVKAMVYTAKNLIGYDAMEAGMAMQNGTQPMLHNFGNLNNFTLSFEMNGIGELINDFLDSTRVFASYSMSETDPKDDMPMLGSLDKEKGHSYWVGVNIPGFRADDSFGVEFNHGSKHWRSFTYGEDTVIGSKLAARGDAFEAYYNLPIIDDVWVAQLRYTKIKYDYTGSNGFFGSASAPMDMETAMMMGMNPVEEAEDIRLLLRYKY